MNCELLLGAAQPVVMGILNVTPDSFYAASRCTSDKAIIERVAQMIDDGLDCLDIGGCSTRPGCTMATGTEGLQRSDRALHVVRKQFPHLPLSVDTFRAAVVQKLYDRHGAFIVNDISAGDDDAAMIDTVARLQLPYIAMHKRGTPDNMQQLTDYDDVVEEVKTYLLQKIKELQAKGVRHLIVDQGFGFAKTVEQNYALFRHIGEFTELGAPLLVGISRKGMLWKPLHTTPENVLCATAALNLQALLQGAKIIRVHDVKEGRQMVMLATLMRD